MNQGGPYLGGGVKRVRWTSRTPLVQMWQISSTTSLRKRA